MIDLASMLPAIIVAVIGFLIRHAFKNFETKLDGAIAKLDKVDERLDRQDRRVSVMDAILKAKGLIS